RFRVAGPSDRGRTAPWRRGRTARPRARDFPGPRRAADVTRSPTLSTLSAPFLLEAALVARGVVLPVVVPVARRVGCLVVVTLDPLEAPDLVEIDGLGGVGVHDRGGHGHLR